MVLYMAQNSRRVGDLTAANAAVLREAVERLGLSQREIGERTGIARSTVGKILAGIRALDIEEHALLAGAVGMAPHRLMAAAAKRLTTGS